MLFTISHGILAWLFTCLSVPVVTVVNAKLYVKTNEHPASLMYPTLDYFLHRQPYYHYEGIGVVWPWNNETNDCTLESITRQSDIRINASSTNVAGLFILMNDAINAGCETVAQIGQAATRLSYQWQSNGYPSIELIVLMKLTNNTEPYWGPNTDEYISHEPGRIPDGVPDINVTMLDQYATRAFLNTFNLITGESFQFTAEQEQGPWNKIYHSPEVIAYQWAYFAVIVVLLLYTWSRIIMLIILGILPRDLRLLSFIFTSIYCLVLLAYLAISDISYINEIIASTVYCLSVISFFIILIQWSIYCKNVFSAVSIVCFQIAVAISFLLLLIMFTMNMLTICCGLKMKRTLESSIFGAYVISFFPLISFVAFAGFAIWFGWCAFQMKSYHELRIRFMQLTIFSILTSATFVVTMLDNIMGAINPLDAQYQSIKRIILFHIFSHTTLFIRAVVCLTVLGIRWPRLKSTREQTTLDVTDTTLNRKSTLYVSDKVYI